MWREYSKRHSSIWLKHTSIMYVYIVLFIISVEFVRTIIINTPLSLEEQNVSTPYDNYIKTEISNEDKLKEMRIAVVKHQILSHLNLIAAPPSIERPSEASKEIVRLLMKEEEELQQKRNRLLSSEERLVIHAKNYNLTCLYSNATYCRMYNFELSQSLNASSVDLWIYKHTTHPKWISIALSSSTSNDKKQHEYYEYYYESHEAGWNKFKLPKMFTPALVNESSYTIEIIGENMEYIGELRPFLLVSKLAFTNLRQRREVSCDTNESCCLSSLTVSLPEIGFNWVLYPSELEVNMCSGNCMNDISKLRPHEIAMLRILENNSSVKDFLGDCGTLCCKPKVLDAVRVLYNDTNGIIHDQSIPNLSVKSCGCF